MGTHGFHWISHGGYSMLSDLKICSACFFLCQTKLNSHCHRFTLCFVLPCLSLSLTLCATCRADIVEFCQASLTWWPRHRCTDVAVPALHSPKSRQDLGLVGFIFFGSPETHWFFNNSIYEIKFICWSITG